MEKNTECLIWHIGYCIFSIWSDEDEKIALSIEQVMNCASLLNIVPDKVDKIKTWLKSLKNRVGCEANFTTTKKWSEENEKILNSLISSLARIGALTRTDSTSINYTFSKEIDWLKSLKPQNRWKPSDEQMKLLKELVEDNNQRHFYALLKSLYEQLKKLKGE